MLNQDIAQRFIDRLGQVLNFNINIMNTEGLIIASRDPSRTGTYHEIAHRVVEQGMDVFVVQDNENCPTGVLPGINVPVSLDGRVIGALGITGDSGDLHNVIQTLKNSFEIMLEYEQSREEQQRRTDHRRVLANTLLYNDPATRNQRNRLLEDSGYMVDVLRVPILFEVPASEIQTLTTLLQDSKHHYPQDIFLTSMEGLPVVLKQLTVPKEGLFKELSDEIETWILEVIRDFVHPLNGGGKRWCFVGSIQDAPERYSLGFHHALWLHKHRDMSQPCLHFGQSQDQDFCVRFFFDSYQEYLHHQVPPMELESLVGVLIKAIPVKRRSLVRETLQALEASSMNIKEAAARLGLHRNSVLFRLQKIHQILGIDPVNRGRDRRIAALLASRLAHLTRE